MSRCVFAFPIGQLRLPNAGPTRSLQPFNKWWCDHLLPRCHFAFSSSLHRGRRLSHRRSMDGATRRKWSGIGVGKRTFAPNHNHHHHRWRRQRRHSTSTPVDRALRPAHLWSVDQHRSDWRGGSSGCSGDDCWATGRVGRCGATDVAATIAIFSSHLSCWFSANYTGTCNMDYGLHCSLCSTPTSYNFEVRVFLSVLPASFYHSVYWCTEASFL